MLLAVAAIIMCNITLSNSDCFHFYLNVDGGHRYLLQKKRDDKVIRIIGSYGMGVILNVGIVVDVSTDFL